MPLLQLVSHPLKLFRAMYHRKQNQNLPCNISCNSFRELTHGAMSTLSATLRVMLHRMSESFIFGNLFANILETKEHSKYVRGGAGEGFLGRSSVVACMRVLSAAETDIPVYGRLNNRAKHLGFLCAYQC